MVTNAAPITIICGDIIIERAMPELKNRKWENLAQLVVHGAAQGLSQAQMYKLAGYKAEGHAAEVAASRLLSKVEVQRRVAEIGAPAVRKAGITAESLIEDFDAVIAGASQKNQWSAVNRAIELRGKLKGFLIDKVEIGEPGAFANCTSPEEIRDKIAAEMGAEAAELFDTIRGRSKGQREPIPADPSLIDAMIADAGSAQKLLDRLDRTRELVMQRAANMAQPVASPEHNKPKRPTDEAALAIELLTPMR